MLTASELFIMAAEQRIKESLTPDRYVIKG